MFSGIVERTGRVAALGGVQHRAGAPAHRRLEVAADDYFHELPAGASVAVNGVCLTLTGSRGRSGAASFDVIHETLQRTNLGRLTPGDPVNLERSLRVADRIDGHFVQGHVDALGRVARIDHRGAEWKLWVTTAGDGLRAVVPKGSVALDGVSLTIVDVRGPSFSVALIPTTLDRTTLGRLRPGDAVNIETDLIARVVLRQLDALGLDSLRPGPAGVPEVPGREVAP